uniref:Bm671, isoform c n=1 Tax=Brugia malayi TaxID=6279 RepID=A0A1I9G4K5_BRUMA|nr:Bm671, isoform c [Brugia malayi]
MSIRYRRMKFQNTEQQSGLFSGPLEIYILLHYKSITLKRQEEIFLEYSNIRNRLEVFGKFKYKQLYCPVCVFRLTAYHPYMHTL